MDTIGPSDIENNEPIYMTIIEPARVEPHSFEELTKDIQILYGADTTYLDITPVILEKFVSDHSITIVARDVNREILFSDPLPKKLKNIVIYDGACVWIVPHNIRTTYSLISKTCSNRLVIKEEDPETIIKLLGAVYGKLNRSFASDDIIASIMSNSKYGTRELSRELNTIYKANITSYLKSGGDIFNIEGSDYDGYGAYVEEYKVPDPANDIISFKTSTRLPVIPPTYNPEYLRKSLITNELLSGNFSRSSHLTQDIYDGYDVSIQNNDILIEQPSYSPSAPVPTMTSITTASLLPQISAHINQQVVHNKIVARLGAIEKMNQRAVNDIWRVIRTNLTLMNGRFNMTPDSQQYLLETIKPTNKVIYMGNDPHGIDALTIASILNNELELLVVTGSRAHTKTILQNRDANHFIFNVHQLSEEEPVVSSFKDIYPIDYKTLIVEYNDPFYSIIVRDVSILTSIQRVIIRKMSADISKALYIQSILKTAGLTLTRNARMYEVWKR